MVDGWADANTFDFILTSCLTKSQERLLLISVKFKFRPSSDL